MNTGENTLQRKFNELIHSFFLKKLLPTRPQAWHNVLEFGDKQRWVRAPDSVEFQATEVQIKYNLQLNIMQKLPEHSILENLKHIFRLAKIEKEKCKKNFFFILGWEKYIKHDFLNKLGGEWKMYFSGWSAYFPDESSVLILPSHLEGI